MNNFSTSSQSADVPIPVALGVCVLPPAVQNRARGTSYSHYIHEILTHAGLCYSIVTYEQLEDQLPHLRVLVTVGEVEFADSAQQALRAWVEDGGAWLSIGGICGLGDLLGAEYVGPEYTGSGFGIIPQCILGEGYLQPEQTAHPILAPLTIALHFFNGLAVQPTPTTQVLAGVLDAHGRATERAALLEHRVQKGRCLLLAPDAVGAVVRIQQGVAVTRDGVPSSDGASPISDGVLKADDGAVLDWHFDRQDVPGLPGLKAFLEPVADGWRELILRAIFYLASEQGLSLPLLWLYPRNLPALAHMSHDSDGNDPAQARRLLEIMAAAGINSTWCILVPGYEAELLEAIRDAGHELSMHYDAMSEDRPWGEDQFEEQWQFLQKAFGELPVSNKNHYTRWEGDTEFFEWCQDRGVQLDQSKGASKIGELGFNFGTCHLYFPVAPDGELLDVLELPTMTQDLVVFAPASASIPMLEAVVRHHGVLHVLFHPAHTVREDVATALLDVVAAAKETGVEWWTARQLNEWERARRQVQWSRQQADGKSFTVCLRAATRLPKATLLWLGSDKGKLWVNEQEYTGATVTRWGFPFRAITLDLDRDVDYVLRVEQNELE